MSHSIKLCRKPLAVAIAALLLVACADAPTKPEGAEATRNKLTQLQSDPQRASLAPVAIKDAEIAVREAETPREDVELAKHLVLMADRKVDIATAQAQARLLEDQRTSLSEQRETARLDSRTREADRANELAGDLQQQIKDLNAQATERGLVVTLGDVLFETGKSTLKGGAPAHLEKLAAFLNKNVNRSIIVEGHTDSVGSESSNLSLSERRANSVRAYLVSRGVDPARIHASGKSEDMPIADNDSATGRQQNRRVEVIIADTPKVVGIDHDE